MDANTRLIQSGYEAYTRRDFAAIFALLDPDVEIAIAHLWTVANGRAVRLAAYVDTPAAS